MGQLLTDKTFLNTNIFKFEQRMESQYTIFLDKTPTFTTYYHINNTNSTADNGFQNVEQIIGENSPIKFQKISDFPIYGIESIQLDLSDEEEGLTTSYEGEGVILPNTVHPLPNDLFTISYLGDRFWFVITNVEYDTIKSNNFYKINYQLRSVNEETKTKVEKQVLDNFTCIFSNIGTNDKCLLKDDEIELYIALGDIYSVFVDKYKLLFYSKRFNSFLLNINNNEMWYDKYLTHFINSNGLLNEKRKYDTFALSNEDYNPRFMYEYDSSIYRAIETQDVDEVSKMRCWLTEVTDMTSVFKYYSASGVKSVMFMDAGNEVYIPDELIDAIKTNVIPDDSSLFDELLIKYFNGSIESIYGLSVPELKKYKMKYGKTDFILVPIILYILRHYANQFISKQ